MSDPASQDPHVQTQIDIAVLKTNMVTVQGDIKTTKDDVRRIFGKLDTVGEEIGSKIDGIHCMKEDTIADHGGRIQHLETAQGTTNATKAKAAGWIGALNWVLRITIAIAGIIIAYMALKNGQPPPG